MYLIFIGEKLYNKGVRHSAEGKGRTRQLDHLRHGEVGEVRQGGRGRGLDQRDRLILDTGTTTLLCEITI